MSPISRGHIVWDILKNRNGRRQRTEAEIRILAGPAFTNPSICALVAVNGGLTLNVPLFVVLILMGQDLATWHF